jgi:hypothetical protein
MHRIALTVGMLALTVATGAQAPTSTSSTTQREPSSILSIYFDQTDKPANLSYKKGTQTLNAKARSVSMTQEEGRLTVKMQGGSWVITTPTGEATMNFASAILWFDINGDLIRYSRAG